MNSIELRTAFSLAFVYVLRMLGLFMVMPVLAINATNYPDYSAFLVGLAIGGYGLTQAILQIPMGILSDKIGRKPIIIGGLIIFSAGSILAGLSENLVWLIIGRFLQGAGAIAGAIMALAGDLSRDTQRPKVMAIIGISIGFSFYLALLLGPIIAGKFGLSGIFLATGCLAVGCILLVIFAVPNAVNIAPKGDTLPVMDDINKLLSNSQLVRLNISVLLLHMMITLVFVQIPVLLVNVSWPLASHWQIYLVILFASIVGLIVLMKIASKHPNSVLKLSVLGLALVFALLASSHTSIVYLILLISLFFTNFNYLEANFPAMVSNIAPAGQKGSAMGIYASFQFLGAFIGGIMSGGISELFGLQWVFIIASLVCVLWLFLIRGLQATNRLKRYTLKTQKQSTDIAFQKLAALKGVTDITIMPSEQVVYLKTDDKHFDIQQAKLLLNIQD